MPEERPTVLEYNPPLTNGLFDSHDLHRNKSGTTSNEGVMSG